MAASQKLLSDLDKIRVKVTGIKTALSDLDRQQIAPQDVPARVDQVVRHLAQRFDSAWLGQVLAGADGPSDHEDVLEQACHHRPSMGVLLAWLHPALLRERLTDLVTEHAADAVPLAQRPAERQRLEQDLYSLEVQEERLVCQLEDAGIEVFRRSDFDPSIVLSLET